MSAAVQTALRRFAPQLVALAAILALDALVFPDFFALEIQNGRLYGSVIDVLNRGAPVALLAIGMTLVIATKGIDLSVGAVMAIAGLLLWRGKLSTSRPALWMLMLAAPFPFIANTTGWMTAELGRQPWLVYGILRTRDGYSATVSSGNTIFSLLGFMGLYALQSLLYLLLIHRELEHGPEEEG